MLTPVERTKWIEFFIIESEMRDPEKRESAKPKKEKVKKTHWMETKALFGRWVNNPPPGSSREKKTRPKRPARR